MEIPGTVGLEYARERFLRNSQSSGDRDRGSSSGPAAAACLALSRSRSDWDEDDGCTGTPFGLLGPPLTRGERTYKK